MAKRIGERTFCEKCDGTGQRDHTVGDIVKRTITKTCGKCWGTGRRPMTALELEADGQFVLIPRASSS